MPDPDPLLFIDTNIFLDFYRATDTADFKLLGRLEKIHDKIISSGQIEVEFQKNRQKQMLASFQKIEVIRARYAVTGGFKKASAVNKS